jgi:MinD-like ATPase involved in chromosome partitioning or flagellar assembly
VLVDADPWGGSVAQQLGVLDEVSGILSASRLAATGALADRFAGVPRDLGGGLSVVTGLPRADRYVEVRPGAVEHLLETARAGADVVVDTGFSLEDDPAAEFGGRPGRNSMTLGALSVADEVVVVGAADPVGLSRLARALVELREPLGGAPVRVVVNRNRPTLGWSERDIAGMVEGFAHLTGLHFLPEDRASVDAALVSGRSLAEAGEGPLVRALAAVADGVVGETAASPGRDRRGPRRLRRRTAGTARPR